VKRFLLLPLVFFVLAVPAAVASSPPPGATALCRDGTYSFSRHRSGTCSYHGGVARWLTGTGSRTVATGATLLLGRRTMTSGCKRAAVPDRRCSPGAYYARLTRAVICATGFRTSAIRNVPQTEKFAVEREYGMAAAYYGRTIEIDHIVPLELGGSNSIANLFPEPGSGNADYHVKDAAENRAKARVCEGGLSLSAARRGFATDWEDLYRRLYGRAP
jgi:5-methylcytosine-specific restriction endonuclease McrA